MRLRDERWTDGEGKYGDKVCTVNAEHCCIKSYAISSDYGKREKFADCTWMAMSSGR
jgi:hypothetical protein